MTSAKTVQYWSYYVGVLGLFLALAPGFAFELLGVDLVEDVWIRVLGVVLLILATYYYAAAISNARTVIVSSLLGRGFAAAAFVVLWLTGAPWQLLLFVAVDLAGLLWTWNALRTETH